MIVTFFDRQDKQNELNGTVISDPNSIIAFLDSLKTRPPFFCELICENGYTLLVGIGSHCGCSQYSLTDGCPPYLIAISKRPSEVSDYTDFLMADTPTPIAARFCLPVETTQKVASHFVLTGKRYQEVEWEEI